MTEWKSILGGDVGMPTQFPDWKDGGPVELRKADGTVVSGTLSVDDAGFDGEDEYPIFKFVDDQGNAQDLFAFEHWRKRVC